MTTLLNIIQIVALMGAVSILAFDKRKSRHCRSASLLEDARMAGIDTVVGKFDRRMLLDELQLIGFGNGVAA